MAILKISVPVYKLNSWSKHEVDGFVEVSSDCDNLSDAYDRLLPQINELLEKLQSQARIASELSDLESQLSSIQSRLSTNKRLLHRATKQYQRLKIFLQQFGVSAGDNFLCIDNTFANFVVSI
ncbi:MAG: hypothetical protein EAZ09_06365 [Oscillatoriales cyanobacterium]|nr:MAG: hypothetical protein EAZ18_14275 [Oscillatoriales cyanobacterium]TAH23758.1 MAG: hypothetical protein EAZ09_06365 [Oscillatoriales cyanobacterium]